jgi:DNA-binding winged helix-turn-helix (wHTH) protein/Tfp pilus assembly protein PilF/TolB-like protein
MSLATKEIFEFGEFRLDVNEHTIERIDGTQNGTLPEKAFQALVLLIRRRGHLVSKDELIGFIWPDTIVEENNLEKCIHHLRHFLGEAPDKTVYIETVRKHGYRFVGNVQAIEVSGSWIPQSFRFDVPAVAPTPPTAVPLADTRDGHRTTSKHSTLHNADIAKPSRRNLLLGVILLASIGGLVILGYYLPGSAGKAVERRDSIAVLPLLPLDPGNRNEIYEMGVADALIHRLSSTKGIVVRPLSATRRYVQLDQDPLSAGREQKVDYVVASNYQIANGKIRVTSQFLNVSTGEVDETFTVAADSSNLFLAQDSIATDIAKRLLARFGSSAGDVPTQRGTNNEEAYRLYLLAMNLSEERGLHNVEKSLSHLERAVELDPTYARAWAAKAHVHADIVGHTDAGQHHHYQSGLIAIEKALALDPNLSDAFSALCHFKNRSEYDADGADAACRRAVELDPNSPVAHKTFANYLYSRGRFDEALVEIKTAIGLQPVSFRNQQMYALTLYFAGRYDEAEDQFKLLIELNPNHSHSYARLIKVLEELGRESEAFDQLIKMMTVEKADDEKLERFRAVYRTSGWRGVSLERIKNANADVSSFQLATMHAKVGDRDKALEYLEAAFRERSSQIAILKVEPQLNSLHSDPRFADLVRRVERK